MNKKVEHPFQGETLESLARKYLELRDHIREQIVEIEGSYNPDDDGESYLDEAQQAELSCLCGLLDFAGDTTREYVIESRVKELREINNDFLETQNWEPGGANYLRRRIDDSVLRDLIIYAVKQNNGD